jgi:hypothetical protein
MRTEDEITEIVGNPGLPNQADEHALQWTGTSLDHVLISPWTRIEDEMAETAGNRLIREHPDFATISHLAPKYTRKNPIKIVKSQNVFAILDWIISVTDFDLACMRTKDLMIKFAGRTSQLVCEHPDFRRLGLSKSYRTREIIRSKISGGSLYATLSTGLYSNWF